MTETRGDDAEEPPIRCFWVPVGDALYAAYHDEEWGFPLDDDVRLFETLSLESFQSGLSWRTILGKRDHFRAAFDDFDFERVARYGPDDVVRLLDDAGIVRHRGKIEATIANARACCELVDREGSLAAFVWRYEPDPAARPDRIDRDTLLQLPQTPGSAALARDLKSRGWSFIGPATAYAFMQAAGLVNDHEEGCAARCRVEEARAALRRPESP